MNNGVMINRCHNMIVCYVGSVTQYDTSVSPTDQVSTQHYYYYNTDHWPGVAGWPVPRTRSPRSWYPTCCQSLLLHWIWGRRQHPLVCHCLVSVIIISSLPCPLCCHAAHCPHCTNTCHHYSHLDTCHLSWDTCHTCLDLVTCHHWQHTLTGYQLSSYINILCSPQFTLRACHNYHHLVRSMSASSVAKHFQDQPTWHVTSELTLENNHTPASFVKDHFQYHQTFKGIWEIFTTKKRTFR